MPPYSDSYWRNACAPIIREVIAAHAGEDESAVRLALRVAYPFGQRKYHPYRVFLDECAVQLGKKLHAQHRSPGAKAKIAAKVADETVGDLFESSAGGDSEP